MEMLSTVAATVEEVRVVAATDVATVAAKVTVARAEELKEE